MTFNERLKKLRAEKGLTIKALSELSGVTSVSISSYENGHRKAHPITIAKLAKALGCSYDYLDC